VEHSSRGQETNTGKGLTVLRHKTTFWAEVMNRTMSVIEEKERIKTITSRKGNKLVISRKGKSRG